MKFRNVGQVLEDGIMYLRFYGHAVMYDALAATNGVVRIKDTVAGVPVTTIGPFAFTSCENDIDEIILPRTIETIRENAFFGCDDVLVRFSNGI